MKYYVGIDPGLETTGFCVLDEVGDLHKAFTLSTGVIHPKSFRYHALEETIMLRLQKLTPVTTCFAAESFWAGSGFVRSEPICAGTAVRNALHALGFPVLDISPSSVKKWLTGTGKAKKNVIQAATLRRYGLFFESDDVCDAYGCASILYACFNPHVCMNKIQKAQIRDIVKKRQDDFFQFLKKDLPERRNVIRIKEYNVNDISTGRAIL